MIAAHLPVAAMATRCFCCGARSWAKEFSGWKRCRYCDMRQPVEELRPPHELSASLRAALFAGRDNRRPVGNGHWRATYRTLRIAGTTNAVWLTGSWHSQHRLADDHRDVLALKPFTAFAPAVVSLVVLSRQNDPALPDLIDRYARLFHDTVVVLSHASEDTRAEGRIRFIARPLDGDFGRQRNAGTQATSGEWVFHLDTDEHLSDDFCEALPNLASAAESSGYVAVGVPRRNFVDGQLSDLFPDIQYRLVRRDVPFEGRVHERPAVCKTGRRAIVSQHGLINHHMPRSRVQLRSELYDGLGQEPARHDDDRALLTPFAP